MGFLQGFAGVLWCLWGLRFRGLPRNMFLPYPIETDRGDVGFTADFF